MFRILFIFFILGVSLYGLYSVFSPLNKAQSVAYFDKYLSEALERNSGDSSLYTVTFNRSEFLDESAVQGIDESSTLTGKNTDTKNTSSVNNNSSLTVHNDNINGQNQENAGKSKKIDVRLTQGSFGTPELPAVNTGFSTNSDCNNGLIFDPCLAIGDPIPASGDMYFGSDRG